MTRKKPSGKKRVQKKPQQAIVITVKQPSQVVPTVEELTQPITPKGKELTIPKTWINAKQLMFMLQTTPPAQIYRRPGKGGKQFDYVTGSYVMKALNYVFAWNWDFEVVEHGKEKNHVWVLGKLTVRGDKPGQQITKTQFGRSEIKTIKGSDQHVDYGNDLKAAATDALKKCASLLGLASDVYGKADYIAESGKQPREVLPAVTVNSNQPKPAGLQPGQIMGPDGLPTFVCASCDEQISDQVAKYSLGIYKKRLCRSCQQDNKK